MKYSQTVQTEVKAKLNIDEFKALLQDPELDPTFLKNIDEIVMPDLEAMPEDDVP